MKNQILLAMLVVVAVYVSAAVIDPVAFIQPQTVFVSDAVIESADTVKVEPTAQSRNLNVGVIGVADRILHRNYYNRYAIPNAIQTQDITYQGNATVTAISANEVGPKQFASAFINGGALNTTFVSIRLSTYRGYGYYFFFEIYGR